jgi:predicted molibdopterin-dependent oxidoreductase YjgC
MVEKISFTINGKPVTVETDPEMMVLDVIRELLNLTGTKHGCDNSTCGTCTIVVNGKAVKSCNLAVKKIAGQRSSRSKDWQRGWSCTRYRKPFPSRAPSSAASAHQAS